MTAENNTNVMNSPDWYSLEQLAAYLGVSYHTINRWKKSGYLPKPNKVGRCTRWNQEVIKNWIIENEGLSSYGRKGSVK